MYKRVEQARNNLIDNMSGEIYTSLERIMEMVDLALHESPGGAVRDRLLAARASGESLLALMDYLLEISKGATEVSELETAEFSLNRMLVDIESLVLIRAAQKELEFAVILGNPLPRRIHSDAKRIRQCLCNLIDNALKFTDEGFVHLRVSTERHYGGASIRFDVEDSGIDICSRDRSRAFKEFDQTDSTVSGRFVGVGMGLAIANQLAGQLGGSITLTSQEGKGTTSSLTIPAGFDPAHQEMITALDRTTVEQRPEDIVAGLSDSMPGLKANMDAAVSAIGEITWLAVGQGPSPLWTSETPDADVADIPIDWTTITNNCGGEDLVALAVETYMEDAPRIVTKLIEAVEAARAEDVELYANTLKRASELIGANQLSKAARILEYQGRAKNRPMFAPLLGEIKENFSKVIVFISQPDWMEIARRQNRKDQ